LKNYLKKINEIKDFFRKDNLSIYYNGILNDSFSEFIVSLAKHESSQAVKKKLSFLMVEVFQNIVRHSDDKVKNDCFGVRNLEESIHIFSSNKIGLSAYEFLSSKLSELNSLDETQLKELYRDILKNGDFNEKGGGGLGLIEMARKSKNPIQKDFKKLSTDSFQFSYQIDLAKLKGKTLQLSQENKIKENIDIFSMLRKNDVMFFYNGNFSKENIEALLVILKANIPKYSRKKNVNYFRMFHTGVELIQNISRHGKKVNNVLHGSFCIFKSKEGFYMTTGNFLKSGDYDQMEEFITNINSYSVGELTTQYLRALKENAFIENDSAGVGLIDIRRYNHSKIDFKINNLDNGIYLNMGIFIPKYI